MLSDWSHQKGVELASRRRHFTITTNHLDDVRMGKILEHLSLLADDAKILFSLVVWNLDTLSNKAWIFGRDANLFHNAQRSMAKRVYDLNKVRIDLLEVLMAEGQTAFPGDLINTDVT